MTVSRRRMLAGLGGLGALALGPSLVSRIARGEPLRAPTRLLIIHRPVGTVPAAYDCMGEGADFALSPILAPFAALREHMVVVDGLEVRKAPNTPGEDHGNCIVTFMTGGVPYRPGGTLLALAERISIDQIIARDRGFSGDVPIRSLQLTANDRTTQLFTRILSYAGRGQPLAPEQDPVAAFARVFGSLGTRGKEQSVLDFARADAARLRGRLGAEGRERIDRHLTAIREVEQVIHQTLDFDTAVLRGRIGAIDNALRDDRHAELGRAHLDIVRAAFECDLTRVAAFQWGSMEINVGKAMPALGTGDISYHQLSHLTGAPDADAALAAVHRWYNEQLAAFLVTLRDTPDVDGRSLLDNTLVVVWSEMRLGSHTFDNLPIQLFGGAGGRLAGGRLVRCAGHTTNDLWLTIANALGVSLASFGDPERGTGPLPGLFVSAR